MRNPYLFADYSRGSQCFTNTPRNVAMILYQARNENEVVISSAWGVTLMVMKKGRIASRDREYLFSRLYPVLFLIGTNEIPITEIEPVNPLTYACEGFFHWLRRYWNEMKGSRLSTIERIRRIRTELTRIEPSPFFTEEETNQ